MADYSTIKGFNVETLASDPYASVVASGTWAAGNDMLTGRQNAAGFGTQTAALAAGGANPYVGIVEEYDGTSWTEKADLTASAGFRGGTGSTAAGLVWGGYPLTTDTESYNGTTWTEVGDLGNTRYGGASAGASNTSALYASGDESGTGTKTTNTEIWNGSTWTEVNDCNTGRYYVVGAGTVTAALATGGNVSPFQQNESYDGTSWTEEADTNSAHDHSAGLAGGGTNTSTLIFSAAPNSAITEYWDGTTWTEVADLGTARQDGQGAGTVTAALMSGGNSTPTKALTEEWNTASPISVAQEGQVWYNSGSKVLKGFAQAGTGAWASGGDVNTARTQCGSAGTQTAALLFLGESPYAAKNRTEEYDGTTWTETNNAITARQAVAITIGTQTTAIAAGGTAGGTPSGILNEQYDGSCWAEGNNLNTPLYSRGAAGSSTAALAWGGTPPAQSINESWNGTSWSEVNNINTARFKCNGAGSQTAAVTAGGQAPAFQAITETWDGTSWAEVGNLNAVATEYSSANAGTSTAWGVFGGARPGVSAACEEWNGTSWSSVASMATARQAVGGGGTTLAGLVSCSNAPLTTACEEFTVPNAIKTFTSS